MFFEASRFGCRNTIFDAMKVTYNTYSCAISGMSRDSIKMDGRGSVECQKWENKDIMVMIEFVLNENNAKIVYSACLLQLKDQKKRELKKRTCRGFEMAFLE